MSKKPLHNAESCFGLTNEEYIGTWFGHDVYKYKTGRSVKQFGLLATCGNEPGEYSTFIFEPRSLHGWIGGDRGDQRIEDYLTTSPLHKAYLMAAIALFLAEAYAEDDAGDHG